MANYVARQNLFPCNEFHLACNHNHNVRSEVLTAVNMKLVVFWNVMPLVWQAGTTFCHIL